MRNCIRPGLARRRNFEQNDVMKNFRYTLLCAAACLTSNLMLAQQDQDEQQPNDDQLQQQAPRENQVQLERAAKVEAVKNQSNSELEAEKTAKETGQTQRQTKTQPVGINPSQPESKPRDLRKVKKPISGKDNLQN